MATGPDLELRRQRTHPSRRGHIVSITPPRNWVGGHQGSTGRPERGTAENPHRPRRRRPWVPIIGHGGKVLGEEMMS